VAQAIVFLALAVLSQNGVRLVDLLEPFGLLLVPAGHVGM
jgi:hypothetical protein